LSQITYHTTVRLFIQKLFWASDEGFIVASCVAPQIRNLRGIQFGELLGGHCSFSIICRQHS